MDAARPAPTTRRHLLQTTAAVSAATVGARLLTACAGKPGGRPARPATTAPVTELRLVPWAGWPVYAGPHWPEFIQPAMDHFEAANPGLRIKVDPPADSGPILAAILAGTGPDVFQQGGLSLFGFRQAGAVLDLTTYVKQDNLPLSTWSPGQIRYVQAEDGLWALPDYVKVDAMAVNLTDLDTLGVPTPDENWTYEDAARLYRQATWDKGGKHHYGVSLEWGGNRLYEYSYVVHWFGGKVLDETRTRCTIATPEAVQGIAWGQDLYRTKVAGGKWDISADTTFAEVGSNALPLYLNTWRDHIKWTFFPVPRFPAGQYSFEALDYNAINAGTKNSDAAWTLQKFVTADPWWQRYCMKYLLRMPGMAALWPEYVTTVESIAPVVRGKNLNWFSEAAAKWGVCSRLFKYNDGVARAVVDSAIATALSGKQDLTAALQAAAMQVNAIEVAGAAMEADAAKVRSQLSSAGAGKTVTFSAPSEQGQGAPASDGSAQVAAKDGVYTLTGGGADVGGVSDNCILACMALTSSAGEFRCRLSGFATTGPNPPNDRLKVGLMARGTLADDAPMVYLAVTGGHGIEIAARPVAGVAPTTQDPASPQDKAGLIGAQSLTAALKQPAANYLLNPVWLRLQRSGASWNFSTSPDGTTWTPAGPPSAVQMAGCWVGIFTTAHGDKGMVKAVFDNLSFTPAKAVRVGKA